MNTEKIARGLGVASIGIGATEIAAPRRLERMMGLEESEQNTALLRVLGVREIMQGVDILSHNDHAPGVHARVVGDLLDGVLMGIAAKHTRRPGGLAGVAAMVMVVVAMDVLCAAMFLREKSRHDSPGAGGQQKRPTPRESAFKVG